MRSACEVHESDLRRYRAERDAAVHERDALKAHLLVEHEKAAQLQRQCARLERERDELAAQLAALREACRGVAGHAAIHEVLADAAPAVDAYTHRAQEQGALWMIESYSKSAGINEPKETLATIAKRICAKARSKESE